MTLRDALKIVNLNGKNGVYEYILKKESDGEPINKIPSLEQITNNYSKVINELLALEHNKPYAMSWYVQYQKDWYYEHCKKKHIKYDGKKKYIGVCFLNHNYEAPKKGLKPWGGDGSNSTIPNGHYDCNAEIHNKFYGCGFEDWNKIIDTPIINTIKKLKLEGVVAEILWELTFYGWTNKTVKKKTSKIKKDLETAVKQIKLEKGKSLTLKELKKEMKSWKNK